MSDDIEARVVAARMKARTEITPETRERAARIADLMRAKGYVANQSEIDALLAAGANVDGIKRHRPIPIGIDTESFLKGPAIELLSPADMLVDLRSAKRPSQRKPDPDHAKKAKARKAAKKARRR